MINMKRVIIAALAIVAMVGCTKEDSYTPESDSSDVVKFSSSQIDTRVSADGSKWSTNESIGISMATVYDSYTSIASANKNVKYTSTNRGEATTVSFAVATDATALLYPNSKDVIFYAYYPWSEDIAAVTYAYEIDVTEQSENLDFMVAETGTTSRQEAAQEFTFSHKMAKITITITGNDNVSTLKDVTASALGLVTKRSYIVAGSDIGDASGTDSGTDVSIPFVMAYETPTVATDPIVKATATAIVHTEGSPSATMTFTLPVDGESDRVFKVALPASSGFEEGNNYCYEIALGNDVPTFTGSTIKGWDGQTSSTIYSDELICFADEKFKSALLAIDGDPDTDNDGEISYLEALAYDGAITVQDAGITSMAEIKYFPNIDQLYCGTNSLTSLDLSANTKLTILSCGSNLLESLNLSACTELYSLNCSSNSLTSLDLSACTKLNYLECTSNSLTELLLPITSTLEKLFCHTNKLSTLDVSECPNVGMTGGSFASGCFFVGNQSSDNGKDGEIEVTVTEDQYTAMNGKLLFTVDGGTYTYNINVTFVTK